MGVTASATILVVDDEVLIRMTVTEELEDAGYACLEAANGKDALALLEAHPEVRLLLTDVGLPGGINGREVAEAARQSQPELPVLFITGYADQSALADADMQRTVVITKPFRAADLLAQVATLLAE
jgi:CheY-like chemotaxis protein